MALELADIVSDPLYQNATEEQRDATLNEFIDERLAPMKDRIPPDVMEGVRAAVKDKFNPSSDLLGGPNATISAPKSGFESAIDFVKPMAEKVVEGASAIAPTGLPPAISVAAPMAVTIPIGMAKDEIKNFQREGLIRKAMGSPRGPVESGMEAGLRGIGLGGIIERSQEPQDLRTALLDLADLTGSAVGMAALTGSASKLTQAQAVLDAAEKAPSLSSAEEEILRTIHENINKTKPPVAEVPPEAAPPAPEAVPPVAPESPVTSGQVDVPGPEPFKVRVFPPEGSPEGMPPLDRRNAAPNAEYGGPERRGPGQFNINKFEDPDVRALLLQQQQDPVWRERIYDAKRGRVSDETLIGLAQAYPLDAEKLLALKSGSVLPAEGVVQAGFITDSAGKAMGLITEKIYAAMEAKDTIAEAKLRQDAQTILGHFYEVATKTRAIASEIARAQRAQQIHIKNLSPVSRQLMNFAMSEGGASVSAEQTNHVIDVLHRLKNPLEINHAIVEALVPSWIDKTLEFATGIKLMSPITWIKNTLGNAILNNIRFQEKAIQGPIDWLYSKATNTPRHVFSSEAKGFAIGWRMGAADAVNTYLQLIETEGVTSAGKFAEGGMRGPAIGGMLGKVIRTGFRQLQAADEASKVWFRQSELYANAYRQAEYEGLTGMDRIKRIEDLVLNPPRRWAKPIEKTTAEYHVQAPLGSVTQIGERARSVLGGIPKLQVPFWRTPVNIFKFLAHRIPPFAEASLIPPFKNFEGGRNADLWKGLEAAKNLQRNPTNPQLLAAERLAGTKAVETLSRMALGHIWAGLTVWLAYEGYITGPGPKNPTERATLLSTGWKPFSIHYGKDYVPIALLADADPISSQLKLAGAWAERMAKFGEAPTAQVLSGMGVDLINAVKQQPYMSGIADLYDAITDPERRWGTWFDRLVASSVVPTPVRQVASVMDPTLRKPVGPLQSIEAGIPGLTKNVPPKRDAFGRPIKNENYFFFRHSKETADPIDLELNRLYGTTGFGFAPRSDRLGDRKLTQSEADAISKFSGELLHEKIAKVMSKEHYQRINDDARKLFLRHIKEQVAKEVSTKYKVDVELRALGLTDLLDKLPPQNAEAIKKRLKFKIESPRYEGKKDAEKTRMLLERIKSYLILHPELRGGDNG